MKCKIELEMDNAAFKPDYHQELYVILRAVLDIVSLNGDGSVLLDSNGNWVGTFTITK